MNKLKNIFHLKSEFSQVYVNFIQVYVMSSIKYSPDLLAIATPGIP